MKRVGTGTRALNFIIDIILISVLAFAAFKTWNWYVLYWHYPFYNFGWFFFGTVFIYYFIFELLAKRTPGKWLSFSKVVNREGRKPSVAQIFMRSLIRITVIDMFFIPFLNKPLHDYLSKTEVVEV